MIPGKVDRSYTSPVQIFPEPISKEGEDGKEEEDDSMPDRVEQIEVYNDTSFLRTTKNEVFAWGKNEKGLLGLGPEIKKMPYPTKVYIPADICRLYVGEGRVFAFMNYKDLALKSDDESYDAVEERDHFDEFPEPLPMSKLELKPRTGFKSFAQTSAEDVIEAAKTGEAKPGGIVAQFRAQN